MNIKIPQDARKHDALLWLCVLIVSLLACSAVFAEGVVKSAGDNITVNCDTPTAYEDGSPIAAGTPMTIKVYATQQPPEVGEAIASSDTCAGIVARTIGMATGQWQVYATATVPGREESVLSNALPFYLDPPKTVRSAAPVLRSVE